MGHLSLPWLDPPQHLPVIGRPEGDYAAVCGGLNMKLKGRCWVGEVLVKLKDAAVLVVEVMPFVGRVGGVHDPLFGHGAGRLREIDLWLDDAEFVWEPATPSLVLSLSSEQLVELLFVVGTEAVTPPNRSAWVTKRLR